MTSSTVQAEPAPQPSGLRRAAGQLGADTRYVMLGFVTSLAAFCTLLPIFLLGLSTIVLVGGAFILATSLYVARVFADMERVGLQQVLHSSIPQPVYRRAQSTGWRRYLTPLACPQSWLDLLYGTFAFIVAIPAFVIAVVWWALVINGFTYALWAWTLPNGEDSQDLPELLFGTESLVAASFFYFALGIFALGTLPWVLRGCALFRAGFARALLLSGALSALQERVDDLSQRRDAAVSAEASALRRLERDLHDGPQQRLVRLAMDLGRVQRQIDQDPETAKVQLAEALNQTKETLAELRALSRGIAPPILADRGLAAALTAVASRCTVPVDLDLRLGGTPEHPTRLPSAVENAAYFIVAESLTNVAKHSMATRCQVEARIMDSALFLMIEDDGVGGAHLAKGHGLGGLAERVHALEGTLGIYSPLGGPTRIVAKLPITAG